MSTQQAAIPLWPDQPPGALGQQPHDLPHITAYLPMVTPATGAALVICPGGGYGALAPHEGHDYALWLNGLGISCFVLQYRLGIHGYQHPWMLADVTRAMRMVRAGAAEWNIDPARIGLMGSSAGGHLAATLLTHFDAGDPASPDPIERVSSRPAVGILCYPVISMGELGHAGSRQNLLGENPAPELIRELSNEQQVSAETPSCFIWHTWEDQTVLVENSMAFATALRQQMVRFDLHIYQQGAHGLGLGDTVPFHAPHPWTHDLTFWLRGHGFVQG